MATVSLVFDVQAADLRTTAFPQLVKANGTNIPVTGYAFDAATEEAVFFGFRAVRYGSGNLTVDVDWYADTATSGDVVWGAQLAAITPNSDTQDVETDALATANTFTDSHLATTGQRLHRAAITVSNLDSIAADDDVRLRVYRVAANGSDTMTGDAVLVRLAVSYSDT
jgi:hypothetical protein